MIRKSTAIWHGDGLHGNGALTTQSGAFRDQPYSFKTRFQNEDGKAGTNPEELVGAAHASCYARWRCRSRSRRRGTCRQRLASRPPLISPRSTTVLRSRRSQELEALLAVTS
jgi:hypothetical protein